MQTEGPGRAKVLADHCHPEVAAVLPARNVLGAEKRQWPALSARRVASFSSSSHSCRGSPPASKSVRAYSRRWSKKRDVVRYLLLQRLDLGGDEGVELHRGRLAESAGMAKSISSLLATSSGRPRVRGYFGAVDLNHLERIEAKLSEQPLRVQGVIPREKILGEILPIDLGVFDVHFTATMPRALRATASWKRSCPFMRCLTVSSHSETAVTSSSTVASPFGGREPAHG